MARTATQGKARAFAGTMLLVVGCAALLTLAGLLVWQLQQIVNDPLGPSAALGMRSIHALQALAFDPAAAHTVATGILISFTALAMTLIGFVMVTRRNKTPRTDIRARKGSPR